MGKPRIVLALLILVLALLSVPTSAQNNHWYKYIESGGSIKGITHDDQYIYVTSSNDLFVAKIDPDTGSIEAMKELIASGTIYVQDIAYYSGSLYIIGSSTDFSNNGESQIVLAIIDTSLSSVKLYTIGISDINLYGYSVEATADGIYITGGIEKNGGDVIVIKLALNGDLSWANEYTFTLNSDRGEEIKYIGDSIYVIGETELTADDLDVFVMKLDPRDGSIIWSEWFGGDSNSGVDFNEFAYSIAGDGEYLYVTGVTESYGDRKVFVLKTDTSGNFIGFYVLSTNTGTTSVGSYITVAGDSLFIVGTTDSYGAGGDDHIVYELNKNDGSVLSAKTIGTSSDEHSKCGTVFNSLLYIGGDSYIAGTQNPSILLYSPAITTLEWTGSEPWENLAVSDQSVSSSSETPYSYSLRASTTLLNANILISDVTASLDNAAYTEHLAVDDQPPVPIPEPIWIPVIVSALVFLLLATKIKKAK